MKYISIFISLCLGLSLLLTSCEEEIEWEVKNEQTLLVVEGEISNENKNHVVYLARTSGLYEEVDKIPVNGANLNITDGTNSYDLVETPGNEGKYETIDVFSGVPGTTYTLIINLDEPINGKSYYEASDVMKDPFIFESAISYIDQIDFITEDDSTYQMITYLYGQQPDSDENFYFGEIYKNDSIITDTITKSIIVNPLEWGTEDEGLVPLFYYEDSKKFVHQTLNFRLMSISEEYYNFLQEVNSASEEPDPLGLSGPLANVKSNVPDALGFFSAVAVETGEFYVQMADEVDK